MTVTFADLKDNVTSELENGSIWGKSEALGDGISLSVHIAPIGRSILDDSTFIVYKNGVEDATGSMNFVNGVYTFTALAESDEVTAYFNYVYWSATQVAAAVNAGISSLFPYFYKAETELVTSDGTSVEYTPTTDNVEVVTRVGLSSSAGTPPYSGLRNTQRETIRDGDNTIIRFFNAPSSGEMRLALVCRPALMSEDTDELDVPDRAAAPIVTYACYSLLNQKVAPRMRSDIQAVVTGRGNLSPRQMNDAANAFLLKFQTQVQGMKMFPWKIY